MHRGQPRLQLRHAVLGLQSLPSAPAQSVPCPRALCRTDLSLRGGVTGKGGYQEEQQPQLVLPVLKPKDLFAIKDGWQRLARQFPVCPENCLWHAVSRPGSVPSLYGLHCAIGMVTMAAYGGLTWCRKGGLLVAAARPSSSSHGEGDVGTDNFTLPAAYLKPAAGFWILEPETTISTFSEGCLLLGCLLWAPNLRFSPFASWPFYHV